MTRHAVVTILSEVSAHRWGPGVEESQAGVGWLRGVIYGMSRKVLSLSHLNLLLLGQRLEITARDSK